MGNQEFLTEGVIAERSFWKGLSRVFEVIEMESLQLTYPVRVSVPLLPSVSCQCIGMIKSYNCL